MWILSDNEDVVLYPPNGWCLTKFKGIKIVMTTTETDYFYLKYFPNNNSESITFMPKRFQAAWKVQKMNDDDIKNETYKMVETLFSVYDATALANRLGISRSMLNSLKGRKYNHAISAATYLKIKELYDDYHSRKLFK